MGKFCPIHQLKLKGSDSAVSILAVRDPASSFFD
jgi:hypothetical protein